MNTFELKTNLAGSAEQPKLIEFLQREKIDFIQTASGLCVKFAGSTGEMSALLAKAGVDSAFAVEAFSARADTRPDVKAFADRA